MQCFVEHAPLLVMPTPMRSAWDGVDSTTVSFLLEVALKEEEKEEGERERATRQRAETLERFFSKRKRKKRRRKKTPRCALPRRAPPCTWRSFCLCSRRSHSEIWMFFSDTLFCYSLFSVCVLLEESSARLGPTADACSCVSSRGHWRSTLRTFTASASTEEYWDLILLVTTSMTQKQPRGRGILCIFGSRVFVPTSWICKKKTSVSHSSTESEVISLDCGLRMDGLSALDLWVVVIEMLRSSKSAESPTHEAAGNCSRHQQIQTLQKGEPRCWSFVKCGLRCHKREFFSRRTLSCTSLEDNEAVI